MNLVREILVYLGYWRNVNNLNDGKGWMVSIVTNENEKDETRVLRIPRWE